MEFSSQSPALYAKILLATWCCKYDLTTLFFLRICDFVGVCFVCACVDALCSLRLFAHIIIYVYIYTILVL